MECGYVCNGVGPNSCRKECGDSLRAGDEECDDGNIDAGDGCSDHCTVEAGYMCDITSESFAVHQWHHMCTQVDGALCIVSNIYYRQNSSSALFSRNISDTQPCGLSSCKEICGNEIKTASETCDDGNWDPNDGCSDECSVECGYVCHGVGPSSCSMTCGDGALASGEECDDGNSADNDGCSSSCTVEAGFRCTDAVL